MDMDFKTLEKEISYTVVFWEKNNPERKYRIGVCIRGLPVCKPVEE